MYEIMETLIGAVLLACVILANLITSLMVAPQANEKLKIRNMFADVFENIVEMYENKNMFGYIYTTLFLIIAIPGILLGMIIRLIITVIVSIYRLGIK